MFRILMINKLLASFFLLIIFLSPVFAFSQSNDTKLRAGIAIEKEISKKFKGSIEIEQRLENNISSFDRLLIEPAISYKLNKKWSIDLIYRLWYQQTREQDYYFHNRVSLGISYDKDIKGIKFKVGSKMQYGLPDMKEDDFYATKKLVSRNNIKLSYEIFGSRFTPYVKYELFTLLDRINPKNYQWRLVLGTSIYVKSNIDLQLFYKFEHEYNILNRMNSNIWGISLRYDI
jgi:hypothetical protein